MGQCISLPLSLPEKDQDNQEFLCLLSKMHFFDLFFPKTYKKGEREREKHTLLRSIIPLHNGICVPTKINTIAEDFKGELKTKITDFCAVCGINWLK